MKFIRAKHIANVVAAASLLAVGSPAFAIASWANLGTICTAAGGSGVDVGNNLGCGTSGGTSLTASGFSTANGSDPSGTAFAAASVYNWGSYGLGVVNAYESAGATGPHASDNQYGTDAILLTFSKAVNLTGVGIGWSGTGSFGQDSDFSVLAYTAPGVATVAAKTLTGAVDNTATTAVNESGTLLSTGWSLIQNYANTPTNGSVAVVAKNVDASLIYSSYWLVSAYNTSYAGGSSMGAGNDYFKLLSIAGNIQPANQTPEPGSIALMGLGLIGIVAARRRKASIV